MKINVSRNSRETVVQGNFRRCLDRLGWFGLTGTNWFNLRHFPEKVDKGSFSYNPEACYLWDCFDYYGNWIELYVATYGVDMDVEFHVPPDVTEIGKRQLETLAWNAGASNIKFIDAP